MTGHGHGLIRLQVIPGTFSEKQATTLGGIFRFWCAEAVGVYELLYNGATRWSFVE